MAYGPVGLPNTGAERETGQTVTTGTTAGRVLELVRLWGPIRATGARASADGIS